MFSLEYRIVACEYDDFTGQHGFFEIICNNCIYGEMYLKEIEEYMDKVSLIDWFERIIKLAKYLAKHEYVVLSDVESYNTWIEFKRKENRLLVSVVEAVKEENSKDIEFSLQNVEFGEWKNQSVDYIQFVKEIEKKSREYLGKIIKYNGDLDLFTNLKQELESLHMP